MVAPLHLPLSEWSYDPGFPLCIDLDGTLVKEHTLWSLKLSLPALLSAWWPKPFECSVKRLWPGIKTRMANMGQLDQGKITYHNALIQHMHRWHQQGVSLYLVTGAPKRIAHHIADDIGLFTDVWSSSEDENLVGETKARRLRNHFGPFGYTYIGDSWKDRPVWSTSKDIITVTPDHSALVRHLQSMRLAQQRFCCLPHEQTKVNH